MVKSRSLALATVLALAGCQKPAPPVMAKGNPNIIDPWVLATEDANAPTPALLWNGQIGFRIARNGSPMLPGGTELPAFSQDSFEAGGEERIVPLDNWYDSREAPPTFQAGVSSHYRQEIDMRTGILRTSWINVDKGRRVSVLRETIIDPFGNPVWGERWSMKAATTNDVTKGKDNYIKDEFEQTHYLPPNVDGGNPPEDTFDDIAKRSTLFWKEFWSTDIEIDGPVEDQQAVHSFLFYLRTAINPDNKRAISPMGLSSRQYFGHVFWDADVWVFPALALLDPDRAATIPLYRLSKLQGARQNYLNWVKAGRPIGNGKKLGNEPADPKAIMFPWESSGTGLETVPGDSRFQHHISGTVLFGLQHAAALGLVSIAAVNQAHGAVGSFYLDRALKGSDGFWGIENTMSPDEHHTGNNDLYTNILANRAVTPSGSVDADLFGLPRDSKSFLTYDNDPIRSYKQAAAVLAIYPLQFPGAEKQAKTMMERFEEKVIKNGPAMSDSVHATIWARLGEPDRAYTTWRKSWQDFTQHPLLMFSEKRTKDVTYFTTGAGGCLQTVLYGFAGLRIDDHKPTHNGAIPLKNGYYLSIKPNLPKAWKSLKIRGLKIMELSYRLEITGDQYTLALEPGQLP